MILWLPILLIWSAIAGLATADRTAHPLTQLLASISVGLAGLLYLAVLALGR